MNAQILISEARRVGVRLFVDGDRLRYSGRPDAVEKLLPQLRANKSALLESLRELQPIQTPVVIDGNSVWSAMLEDVAERTAIIESNGVVAAEGANALAIRLVQCRSCQSFDPDRLNPLGGDGRCLVAAERFAMKLRTDPGGEAPLRYCTAWRVGK